MIKSDCHTHTAFSDDCCTALDTAIEQAVLQRIKVLAITDHYDPAYPNPDYPFIIDFEKYRPALLEARNRYSDRIDIRAGIEVGIKEGEFEESDKTLQPVYLPGYGTFAYDLVIGSFHCYKDMDISVFDFSCLDSDGGRESFLLKFYEYMYSCLKRFSNYDILGHFSVIDRHIGDILGRSRDTVPFRFLYDYDKIGDGKGHTLSEIIREILKLLVSQNKSLEINTSSFHYQMGCWLPRESILKAYYELGGRMISFGSDAHTPAYYRHHFDDAAEFAKSIGFDFHCTYKNREPEFHRL